MLRFKYDNGLFDPQHIIKKAHEAMAKRNWNRGGTNLAVRGANNPAKRPESRAKIRAAKLERNWMRGRTGALHHNYLGGKIWWRGANWDAIKLRVKQRDAFMCAQCDMTEWQNYEKFGMPLSVDHIVMYRISHDNAMQNLQTLCSICHAKKIPEEKSLVLAVQQILAA
jgi:hypothetical protein